MTQPIRILHVLTAMNLAGTETLLMNLYRNIDRDKIQFDFAVTAKSECAYDREILQLGGRIIHYPLYRGMNHFSYVKWWNDFFCTHKEYRIIHGHIGSTAAIYLHIANKYGCYTIAHSHSTYGPINLHTVLYKIYSFPTRYVAKYFMGCSKLALRDRYGKSILKKNNWHILNNGIDSKKYIYSEIIRQNVRKEMNLTDNDILIGTVGRLTPQKNPNLIINIIKNLNKDKIKFKFLWIGIGELEKEISKKLSCEIKRGQVIMAGARTDVNKFLQGMDIFVFPSIFEGLGIAAIEAQAAGLITLCSDTIPPEVKVTECCEFLSIQDAEIWSDRIRDIIKNSSYKERKNQCNSIVNAHYDIHNVAQWLTEFYRNI